MTTAFFKKVSALAVAAYVSTVSISSATVIYDNSVTDLNYRFNPGTLEVGDEFFIAGSSRVLTNFSFEYWALANGLPSGTFAGTPQVQVKFYLNDGPLFNGYKTPGTVFYNSGWFNIPNPTDRSTLVFDISDFGGGLLIPLGVGASNFTFSIQFQGLGGTDTAGVDIYGPPAVGTALSDYWEFGVGGWTLKTNISVDINFAAQFQATIPEPTSVGLVMMGGIALMGLRWRFARK